MSARGALGLDAESAASIGRKEDQHDTQRKVLEASQKWPPQVPEAQQEVEGGFQWQREPASMGAPRPGSAASAASGKGGQSWQRDAG